jgi:hypothetical protein
MRSPPGVQCGYLQLMRSVGGGGGVEWNWIKSFTRDRGARALGSLWVWEAETGGEHLVGLSP